MASFWEAIETAPYYLEEVAASWQRRMGADFEAARRTFLRRTGEEATCYPSTSLCGCHLRVVKHAADDIVGVSDCGFTECNNVTLTAADIALWALNFEKLGRGVARAFGCELKEADLGLPLTRQIGLFGGSVPVVLTIRPERVGFYQVLTHLVATLKERFIVLAPTLQCYDGPSQALLKGNKVGFFDLATWMTLLPDGTLQARRSGAELFADWCVPHGPPVLESEARRLFAVMQKLKTRRAGMKAPLYDVFVLTVLEGFSHRAAARRCKCSLGLLATRAAELEEEFGIPLKQLKAYVSPLLELETSVKGDRRRKRKAGAAADGFGDDEPGDDDAPVDEELADGG